MERPNDDLVDPGSVETNELRRVILERLADAEHILRRREVAALLKPFAHDLPGELERILDHLAADQAPAVREVAAAALGRFLAELDAAEATWILVDWATSRKRWRRLAVARALRGPVSILGVPSAIELLAVDPHPDVRRAAAEAAVARLPELPDRLVQLLERLAADERRSVRELAIDGLRHAAELGLVDELTPELAACAEAVDPPSAERALDALDGAVSIMPERALDGYELITDQAGALDEQVVHRLIRGVCAAGVRANCPDRARRLLRRIERHPATWLQDAARDALTALG